MPALGLGVYRSSPEQTVTAVESALAQGYRLIDTAAAYLNERQVGEAISRSGLARELFVQTKLWISDYGYGTALRACDTSLRKLGLAFVDLYLLHQRCRTRGRGSWRRTARPRSSSPTDGCAPSASPTSARSTLTT